LAETLHQLIAESLGILESRGPQPIANLVRRLGEIDASTTSIVDMILELPPTDPVHFDFHRLLLVWDNEKDPAWGSPLTVRNSSERRLQVLELLGVDGYGVVELNAAFRLPSERVVVISDEWERWYETEGHRFPAFYWPRYERMLSRRPNWTPAALRNLDESSTAVVERLARPWREDAYQSRGLVVGHVQSGKTTNFTAVIAKAIDEGYRLIIVFTGTIDILRAQTQRRLDMELVGRENILGGISEDDSELLAELDYQQDADWEAHNFVEYGVSPVDLGAPEIRRLTRHKWDYKRLLNGLATLDYSKDRVNASLPLFHESNLGQSSVRLMVVKKNATVLDRLIKDLRSIHAPLAEIPALIIDDESDLASVDTTALGARWIEGKRERTKINSKISELMRMMKRAQYVGYTATPFANVFIDPDDSEDLYPRDFIISLPTPPNYLGPAAFHDLDFDTATRSERTLETSNELAFVRNASAESPEEDDRIIQAALDSFVISGAIKLYRQHIGLGAFRHHTLLVHIAVRQAAHEEIAHQWDLAWKNSSFHSKDGLERLKTLWLTDFVPTSLARGGELPEDFETIIPFVGEVLAKVAGSSGSAVIVVNGNKNSDYLQEGLNFDVDPVWKILVGGAKLSRGFTVEGLTVSYYRRGAGQEDTLLQMGRWFGYRDGYADVVRLYIGRKEKVGKLLKVDLYSAFEAVVRDESAFRSQLALYAMPVDGEDPIRPWEVPPLVSQALPWLRPTARNKMFNAEMVSSGFPGILRDFDAHSIRKSNADNFELMRPLVDKLGDAQIFKSYRNQREQSFLARTAILQPGELIRVLDGFSESTGPRMQAETEYLRRLIANDELHRWVVFFPELAHVERRTVGGIENLPIIQRSRRLPPRMGFTGSSAAQRFAPLMIAGVDFPYEDSNAMALRGGRSHCGTTAYICRRHGRRCQRPEQTPTINVDVRCRVDLFAGHAGQRAQNSNSSIQSQKERRQLAGRTDLVDSTDSLQSGVPKLRTLERAGTSLRRLTHATRLMAIGWDIDTDALTRDGRARIKSQS
jgi:Z1 domain